MPSPKKILVCSDFHIPFHSPRAISAMLQRVREWKPDRLVINGDFLDCASISRFVKSPKTPLLQEELNIGKKVLGWIKSAMPPECRLYVLGGNHEKRLPALIQSAAPGLWGLEALSYQKLLGLDPGEWFEYGKIVRPVHNVICWHGNKVRAHAGYTAKCELLATGPAADVLCTGHTHRLGVHYRTDLCGTRAAVECGCMCDPGKADYLVGPMDWQCGFVELVMRPGCPPQITTRACKA